VLEHIVELLRGLPTEARVFIISMLPIAELRGGLPLALKWGIPWREAYLICVAGNFVPIIPILFLLDPVATYLRRFRLFDRFFSWLFARTLKRGAMIERYEALGLVLFVAIPLPVTGGWTGAVAAFLFGIRRRYAMPAILLGIMLAGLIVSGAAQGFLHLLGP